MLWIESPDLQSFRSWKSIKFGVLLPVLKGTEQNLSTKFAN